MKLRKTTVAALSAAILSLSSCGAMMAPGAGQNGSQTSQSNGNDAIAGSGIGQAIMNILSGKLIPTESQIVGTWVYDTPAVVFNSDNVLSSIGGQVASSGIENKLQSYLNKYGITSGNTSITFNKDKTFTANVKGKAINGKYIINGQTVQMTFDGMAQPSKMTPQLSNGSLIIVGDATKLMTFVQGLGAASSNQQIAGITTLMKQFNGMQLGIRLQKK